MLAVLLALISSGCYGVSDFLGGEQSRAKPQRAVLLVSQATGLTIIVLVCLVVGDPRPSSHFLLDGCLAGVAEVVAVSALYRGLAIGTAAVVAPLAATAPGVAVVVAIVGGTVPSGFQGVGIVICLTGIVVLARSSPGAADASGGGAGYGVLAALGLGAFLVLLDDASEASVPWALLSARVTTVVVFAAAVAAARRPIGIGRRDVAPLAAVGALVVGGDGFYALATTRGALAVVAVLGSLYPVVTIGLARSRLGERPSRAQNAGGALALLGAAVLAAA